MRYAWNFSHGLGLVWNPGEYIQGYTNLLMTLVMSFATMIFDKSTAVLFIQVLGVGFLLAIAYVTMKIAEHIVQDESHQTQVMVKYISLICSLFYYPLSYWSLMGMETGLLSLLLLLSVLLTFNYTKNYNHALLFLVAGCLGFGYLTRNDSIIFAILIWSYIIWGTSKSKLKRKIFWPLIAAITLYCLVVVGQGLFQYLYYGELLPNTYTLKLTGMPLIARLKNGLMFVLPFLVVTAFVLGLSIADLFFDCQKQKVLLLSIALSAIAYQVYVGGDPWPYWRIMSPSMPLLTILFVSAITAAVHAISSTQSFSIYFLRNPIFPRKYVTEVLIISVALLGLVLVNVRFVTQILFINKPYLTESNKNNVDIAIVLSQLTTSDATVGVYWAGSIPYFTGRRAIDFLGKSDRYIAHLPPDVSGSISWSHMRSVPGHNKYDLNYSIKALKPTYIQGVKWGVQDLSQWADSRYVKVKYEGVSLFLLKDSPAVLWSKLSGS